MNRSDFQRLATVRLEEARTLLKHGKYAGCYYLSGYVIECALKASIAKLTRRYDFPDRQFVQGVYTHDLAQLVRLADLDGALNEDIARNPIFQFNWNIVKRWREHSRYELPNKAQADQMFQAAADRRHGVLRWVRQHW
ncbi:MAG: HEPN domain-containing protein [Bryobacterales bacterium]|nr:HEPN domain-containing protein [Bryobacterales bacterium]